MQVHRRCVYMATDWLEIGTSIRLQHGLLALLQQCHLPSMHLCGTIWRSTVSLDSLLRQWGSLCEGILFSCIFL